MIALLEKRIDDRRFIDLVRSLLRAGYLEDWTFHATFSGTPQGGVVSPVLANVCLHELDCFMAGLKDQFDRGKQRRESREHVRQRVRVGRIRRQYRLLKAAGGDADRLTDLRREARREAATLRTLRHGDPRDPDFKRLLYCRYADDVAIGVIGSRAEAEAIMESVTAFVEATLKLTVSREKSGVSHARDGIRFLGYQLRAYTGDCTRKLRRPGGYYTQRTVAAMMQLRIPRDKLAAFCRAHEYGDYAAATGEHRNKLLYLSEAEIVLVFNAELRGLANYYALAINAKRELNKLEYLWRTSLFKTLAAKRRCSVHRVAHQLKATHGYAVRVKQGPETLTIRIYRIKDLVRPAREDARLDLPDHQFALRYARTDIVRRLLARRCEYCGDDEGPFEVHHIRKMRDVAPGRTGWEKQMLARRRKTLVLCVTCHRRLHAGTLPGRPTSVSSTERSRRARSIER
jgi:RNA-directed DNA polymerase